MTKLIRQQSIGIQLPVRAIAHKLLVGISLFVLGFTTVACSPADSAAQVTKESVSTESVAISATTTKEVLPETIETATFAGGCFWCMEPPFDALPGVLSTTSGYTGGQVANPTYTQVSNGNTGHFEAMQVTYDPSQVAYETLLDTFWHNIDPLDNQGQFCDKGSQYRSAIFYDTTEQQQLAEAAKQTVASQLGSSVATEILPAAPFYPAEDYHQDYYQTHPVRYRVYRFGCGRDQRLSEVWGEDAAAHD
ncbi:MAG: peptide-methionine (S)-S-oxide reductase MsrA [Cyanobacteria bacterium P01_D01_bin.1]